MDNGRPQAGHEMRALIAEDIQTYLQEHLRKSLLRFITLRQCGRR
jgi:hypothetical protein